MRKICMYGVRGSGKTCFLYAMTQVMQRGAYYEPTDMRISMIANDPMQQKQLNEGFHCMAVDNKWPEGTSETTPYDLLVRLQTDDTYTEIIPHLMLTDYAGGLIEAYDQSQSSLNELLSSFADAITTIFIVDGHTLLQALDLEDLSDAHQDLYSATNMLVARNKISYIENLFLAHRRKGLATPSVLIAITKSDVFANESELFAAKKLIREYLPSIFSKGSGLDAGLCAVSLGSNLSTQGVDEILGSLDLSTNKNLHIPILFALYQYLDSVYDGSAPDEQELIDHVQSTMRRMFEGRIDLYSNGYSVIEIK